MKSSHSQHADERRAGRHHLRRIAAFAVLLVAAGCGRTQSPEIGGRVLVGLLSEPRTLNPLLATKTETQDIVNLMFIRLGREKEDFLGVEPRLATGWSFSPDSMSITFTLRDDVRWHDGAPVTAEDVRFSWQMQSSPEVGWASRSLKDRITDVEVLSATEVRFTFAERYFYQLLDAVDGVILPKHLLESVPIDSLATTAFSRRPVGAGPYRFKNWVAGQYIELERNPDYYQEGRPHIESVVFRFVPDMTNLVTQLKTGEIDCLESLPLDALDDIEDKYPDVRVHRFLSRGMNAVVWNLEDDLFADRAVRRALAHAINGPEMVAALWGGMAEVCNSPMHPLLWAHDPSIEPIAYDPEAARAELARLGWRDTNKDGILDKDGVAFEFDMTTNQGVQVRADVMAMVQEYLRRVGVKVNPRVLEWNTFIQGVVKGEYQSCVLGWNVTGRADLTSFWHSSSVTPAGFNACRYKNPHVDALIEKARSTLDRGLAEQLWHECQREIYEDQPIYFIAVPYDVTGLRDRYCDVTPSVHGFFRNLSEWRLGNDCR